MTLSAFDDYCVHQSANVIRQPVSDSRDAYDRYFANGFARDGRFYFAISLGRYPNREVMDAAITFQLGGVHHSFFASRRDPAEPTEMQLGPFELRIDRPMRTMSITLLPNESGMSCHLLWLARSAPIEETRSTTVMEGGAIQDITRWTQFGCWSGWFEIDGERIEVDPDLCPGVKDRSWGVRVYGLGSDDPEATGSSAEEPAFWDWIPLNFGDLAVHALRFESGEASIMQEAFIAPMFGNETEVPIQTTDIERVSSWTHDYHVSQTSGAILGGQIALDRGTGKPEQEIIDIGPPILTAFPYAIGYNHPRWGHGVWRGELATGHERWDVADIDTSTPQFRLMHQIVPVRFGDRTGIGFIEQSIVGPYPRYGFG